MAGTVRNKKQMFFTYSSFSSWLGKEHFFILHGNARYLVPYLSATLNPRRIRNISMLPGLNLEQPDTRPFTKHKIGSKPNLEVQMFKEVSNQNLSEYSSYTLYFRHIFFSSQSLLVRYRDKSFESMMSQFRLVWWSVLFLFPCFATQVVRFMFFYDFIVVLTTLCRQRDSNCR